MTGRACLWLNLEPSLYQGVGILQLIITPHHFRSFFHVSSDISQPNRRELNQSLVRPKKHRILRCSDVGQSCLNSTHDPIGSPIRDMCDKNNKTELPCHRDLACQAENVRWFRK